MHVSMMNAAGPVQQVHATQLAGTYFFPTSGLRAILILLKGPNNELFPSLMVSRETNTDRRTRVLAARWGRRREQVLFHHF